MKKILKVGMKGGGASSFLRFMRWARFFLSPVEKRRRSFKSELQNENRSRHKIHAAWKPKVITQVGPKNLVLHKPYTHRVALVKSNATLPKLMLSDTCWFEPNS